VLFYLDGTQGAGALRYDMAALDPDIFAVHAYKWMLGPTGAAFAYFAPRVREWLQPNVIGWRSHRDWRNVAALHHGRPEFAPEAERYEGQMMASLLFYMLEASVDLMLEIGPAEIERRVLGLAAAAREAAESVGLEVVTGGVSPITAVRFAGDAGRLAKALKANRVAVSVRHGNIRISTHFYNDAEDLSVLRDCIKIAC
jgi:selenocysteine lyase/cysteine desulfurase